VVAGFGQGIRNRWAESASGRESMAVGNGTATVAGADDGIDATGAVPLFDPCTTGQPQGSNQVGGAGSGAQTAPMWFGDFGDFSDEQDLFAGMDFSMFWDENSDWLGRGTGMQQ
jgi:hypothetical protein